MSDVTTTQRHDITTLHLFVIHTDQICDSQVFFQNALVEYIGVYTDTKNITEIIYTGKRCNNMMNSIIWPILTNLANATLCQTEFPMNQSVEFLNSQSFNTLPCENSIFCFCYFINLMFPFLTSENSPLC